MDLDTATFLHMVERFADHNKELTEAELIIAFMVASIDVLGKVNPQKLALDFDGVKNMAMRVINVAEAEGFVVIQEEM